MNGFLHYFLSSLNPMVNLGFSRALPELMRSELLLWWFVFFLSFVLLVLPSIITWLFYLLKPASIRPPLPVRPNQALLTRLQEVEYALKFSMGRFTMARLDLLNIISGMGGLFRAEILHRLGGFDSVSALFALDDGPRAVCRNLRAVSDRRQAPLCSRPRLGGDPMVVRLVAQRDYWRPVRATIVLVGLAVAPAPAQSAGPVPSVFAPVGSQWAHPDAPETYGGSAVGPVPVTPGFDPAAVAFFSLWSYGAMRAIAPSIFGNFSSPLGLPSPSMSSSFGTTPIGPMSAMLGSDPTVGVSTSETISAGAVDFGVGVGSVAPTGTEAALGGIHPICQDNKEATRLQAGGKFFTAPAVNAGPVQFPPGVFTGMALRSANFLSDPMLDPSGRGSDSASVYPSDPTLSPTGDPTNVPPPGAAGSWCRPPPVPFAESSPLESRTLWIIGAIMLVGLAVFWLSRGINLPSPAESA